MSQIAHFFTNCGQQLVKTGKKLLHQGVKTLIHTAGKWIEKQINTLCTALESKLSHLCGQVDQQIASFSKGIESPLMQTSHAPARTVAQLKQTTAAISIPLTEQGTTHNINGTIIPAITPAFPTISTTA